MERFLLGFLTAGAILSVEASQKICSQGCLNGEQGVRVARARKFLDFAEFARGFGAHHWQTFTVPLKRETMIY